MKSEKLSMRQIERIVEQWRRADVVRYQLFEFLVARSSRAICDLSLTVARRCGELQQVRADAFYIANKAADPAQERQWYE